MTNVTMFRNEMSTVLPLLHYRDVSSKLEYFGEDKPRVRVTHVAVLNHTIERYPKGAFCLLLRRQYELDACLRLPAVAAILPHLGDLVFRFEKTKLLICPGPSCLQRNERIATMFSFKSDYFHVKTWNAKGTISDFIPSAQAEDNSEFEIQTSKSESAKSSVQMSCHRVDPQDLTLTLTVQLIRMNETWSIKEVVVRKPGSRERNVRTRFWSSILADRCLFQLPDGKDLSVKLRRLPGSARGQGEDHVSKIRYQISIVPVR